MDFLRVCRAGDNVGVWGRRRFWRSWWISACVTGFARTRRRPRAREHVQHCTVSACGHVSSTPPIFLHKLACPLEPPAPRKAPQTRQNPPAAPATSYGSSPPHKSLRSCAQTQHAVGSAHVKASERQVKVSERWRETPVHKRLHVSDGAELLVEKHDKVDEMVE